MLGRLDALRAMSPRSRFLALAQIGVMKSDWEDLVAMDEAANMEETHGGELAANGLYCERLGLRHPAICNLTCYETLPLARVRPVNSVVTLLLTAQLCFAGHVCNYFVKVFWWLRELPNLLRDKNCTSSRRGTRRGARWLWTRLRGALGMAS